MTPNSSRYWHKLVQVTTVADALPSVFQAVVTSGKYSGLAVLAVYLVVVLVLVGPFWLLSFLVTEWGVYAVIVASIFYLGRAIIRMIAFPGASSKVTAEVESEFAKYSVRMLVASANCLRELSSAIHQSSLDGSGGPSSSSSTLSNYELAPLWKRTLSYRDRALGVYLEVLLFVYEQQQQTSPPSSQNNQVRTRFGTNRIQGDIGNFSGITPQAREDGRELLRLLQKIMQQLDQLEQRAGSVFHNTNNPYGSSSNTRPTFSPEAQETASLLLASANELRDFVSALKPPGDEGGDANSTASPTAQQQQQLQQQEQGGAMDAIKGGLSSILPMLDPPLHTSIFGMDVLRGTVLSRYVGARQLWVPRQDGGMLDVLYIPGTAAQQSSPQQNIVQQQPRKAVMYCNPNAGLYEVATGMSLAGGNIGDPPQAGDDTAATAACWTDFYTELGYDMYLFNYAGFGRSFGTSMCASSSQPNNLVEPPQAGAAAVIHRVIRIFKGLFLTFKPTPDTLRADGVALASYIARDQSVASLVIHGESIGGVAASRSAQTLSTVPIMREKLQLLVCDRTFCNLEAVAQRLVGNWSGYAIRMLAPLWNTDVAGDFLAASCHKVVANDFADAIIADGSSLKTGVALWREIKRGMSTTRGIGWVTETPVEYRMADWENVSVVGSHYVAAGHVNRCAPVWPQDKHITLAEAFHFAACTKRIGRVAKQSGRRRSSQSEEMELGGGGPVTNPIQSAWEALSCCDGLCGAPLGAAVKIGFDETLAWLCCLLTYGGQIVVDNAERRLAATMPSATDRPPVVVPSDFDQRPEGYTSQESAKLMHPKPVPEVLESIKGLIASNKDAFLTVQHEMDFVVGMLEYIVARLSSAPNVETSWRCKHGVQDETAVGMFLNLHCGHNSAFSKPEQDQLKAILTKAAGT
ncbi:whole genome shotgun sequence [Seminavis robusta]|uniref:Whole genome shotgun sequence n=1 Tax=Seminavis robusta TaxID=568900 RepID=A0A9N8H502_9STRA|nr:whole genome shotgun sequence [Seminavis robusta]|eukprot:Sro74_g040950.1 whole genome shotgun sequence (918) ;mRNA; f:124222-127402